MERIKIFELTNRRAALPEFNLPEIYARTTSDFRDLYKKAGVYLLYSSKEAKKPTYIGRSKSDAGRTIARHFQKWDAKELKYTERDPKQLDKFYVEFIEMDASEPDAIIEKETELIEEYKPYLNIRKNAIKSKNPDFYEVTAEKRAMLDAAVKQYEAEQAARDDYERALYEYEQAEAARLAAEEEQAAAAQAAAEAETAREQERADREKQQADEQLKAAQEKERLMEKALAKKKRKYTFKTKKR